MCQCGPVAQIQPAGCGSVLVDATGPVAHAVLQVANVPYNGTSFNGNVTSGSGTAGGAAAGAGAAAAAA